MRFAKWWLCLAILLCGGPGYAIIVDFQGIPAGTPVSAGNPYADILNLQATVSSVVDEPGFPVVTTEATIENVTYTPDGTVVPAVAAVPVFYPPTLTTYSSQLTATFSQPVFDVSFSAFCFRFAGYTYNGLTVWECPSPAMELFPGLSTVPRRFRHRSKPFP